MKLRNKYGKVAIEISSVRADDGIVVIKGEALGSMPVVVNLTPEDMWEARVFMTGPVIRRVIAMFFRGWWRSHRPRRTPETTERPR